MTADDVRGILLRTATVTGWTHLVVIGSQAIHGAIPDPDIEAVQISPDVDLYPASGYGHNITWEKLMAELGSESDFHLETTHYVEGVPVNLARFPEGWEGRALSRVIGTVDLNGETVPVTATFPEIHDLTVAKLSRADIPAKGSRFRARCRPARLHRAERPRRTLPGCTRDDRRKNRLGP